MRDGKVLKITSRLLGGAMLAALLAGTATAATVKYQQRPQGAIATGYVDVKKDPSHYVVVYSAADEAQAKKYLELRAAQIGQSAGFSHFVIGNSGTRTLRVTEREFENNFGVYEHGVDRFGFPLNPTDYIPRAYPISSSKFYDVWADVTYLTPEQARGQAGAVPVSQVLAAQNN